MYFKKTIGKTKITKTLNNNSQQQKNNHLYNCIFQMDWLKLIYSIRRSMIVCKIL